MWCHLTFRCQSNWLTGKKSTVKGPFLPKPARGDCQRRWEEQDWGPCGPTGWGKVAGEQTSKPLASLFWPWEKWEEGISHLREPPSPSPIIQHGGLGPMGVWDPRRERADPNNFAGGLFCAEPGKMGFSHLARGFGVSVFFSAPVQDKERRDLKGKSFLSWPLGKKQN